MTRPFGSVGFNARPPDESPLWASHGHAVVCTLRPRFAVGVSPLAVSVAVAVTVSVAVAVAVLAVPTVAVGSPFFGVFAEQPATATAWRASEAVGRVRHALRRAGGP